MASIRLKNSQDNEESALKRQQGKTIKSIQHHEILGLLEMHLTDGSCVSVQAHGKSDTSLMITEPNN